MTIRTLAGIAVMTAAGTTCGWAGDPVQGELIASRCVACHGPAGVTDNPTIPNIAGQNGAYLFNQLNNFREGSRRNPLMSPIAQALTPAEIDNVATYFARLDRNGLPQQAASAAKPSNGG